MTNDEDEWLSDFLETAQASARQSQTTAEKDYGTKLRLFTPRFERARACDTEESLAKRLAASEALAGQRKFDAASDALDEAFVVAGDILRNAAPAAEEKGPATESESAEEIAAETIAGGAAAEAVGEALIEEPTIETAVEEPAAEAPAEGSVADEYVAEEPASEVVAGEPAEETATSEPASGSDPDPLTAEYASENPEGTAEESAEAAPADEGSGFVPTDSFSLSVAPDTESASTEDAPSETESAESYGESEEPVVQEEESGAGSPPPEEPDQPTKQRRS